MVRLALKLETLIENDLAFKCQVFCKFYRFWHLKLKRKGRENEKMTVLVKNRPSKICGKKQKQKAVALKIYQWKTQENDFQNVSENYL